jgi:hypothetical protein
MFYDSFCVENAEGLRDYLHEACQFPLSSFSKPTPLPFKQLDGARSKRLDELSVEIKGATVILSSKSRYGVTDLFIANRADGFPLPIWAVNVIR